VVIKYDMCCMFALMFAILEGQSNADPRAV
jgi:hypothetical protein